MPQLTFDVTAQLTVIHIRVEDAHLILEGNVLDTTTGLVLRTHREDVTSLLTPTQQGYVQSIVDRAQQWVLSKVS